jgi:hypothetical protein
MSERFVPNNSAEKPKRGSPQEIINEYLEVKELITWLIQEGRNADPALRTHKQYRLNLLFMKHELSPGDLPESARKFQELADDAEKLINPPERYRG